MLILMISILASIVGAIIFQLGIYSVQISVFLNAFKILIGVVFIGSAIFFIRKARNRT
jgi:hypothetical protein